MKREGIHIWAHAWRRQVKFGYVLCWGTAFPEDREAPTVNGWTVYALMESPAWKRLQKAGDRFGAACERALAKKGVAA